MFHKSLDLNQFGNQKDEFHSSLAQYHNNFNWNLHDVDANNLANTTFAMDQDAAFVQVQIQDGNTDTNKIELWQWFLIIWGALLAIYAILAAAFLWQRQAAVTWSKRNDVQSLQAQSRLTFVATSPEEEERSFSQSGLRKNLKDCFLSNFDSAPNNLNSAMSISPICFLASKFTIFFAKQNQQKIHMSTQNRHFVLGMSRFSLDELCGILP